MSCVVAGLRYYFRIYKYEYLGELMTSELHIILSFAVLVSLLAATVIANFIFGYGKFAVMVYFPFQLICSHHHLRF